MIATIIISCVQDFINDSCSTVCKPKLLSEV